MSETSEVESDFPTAWRPEPGDTITGRMVEVNVINPNGQGDYPVLTLEEADGERVAVHAFHSVLQKGIARCFPKLGDELTIQYRGKKQGANREYHDYRVTGGQQQQVDWNRFLPAEERQSSSDPPMASSWASAGAPAAQASLAPAAAEDFSPLSPSQEPSIQERAAENFPDESVPF